MRNPERIDNFCNEFALLWKQYFPDLRFGQLMLNFLSWANSNKGDPFFPEENATLANFKEYCQKYSQWA